MSWQVGSSCYSSEAAAASAQAASMGGAVVQHGPSAYVVEVGTVTGSSITYLFHPVGGGTALTLATPYSPQPCGLLGWADGLELGWAVGGTWIIVAAFLHIAKAVNGWGSDHAGGNT